jgi:ParB family chromosome partitioning protein
MHKKALGRGLDTLIPVGLTSVVDRDVRREEILEIAVSLITPNPYQPRRIFDDEGLRELAESVKTKGIIQPILIRRLGDGHFELIAGERRLRAAKLAGQDTIPAIIRPASDAESMEMALIENLQRKDLNPLEAAKAYQRLMKEFGLTQEELSARLGKERSSIANTVRLLSLPPEVQAWVEQEQLSLGHAKVLLGLSNPEQQVHLGGRAVQDRLSVRELERLVNAAPRKARVRTANRKAPHAVEDQLKRRLGTKVHVIEGKLGGRIVIEYYAPAELERIVEVILGC